MFVFLIRHVLCICVYTFGRAPLSTRAIVRAVLCVTIDVTVRSLGSSRVCVRICVCVRSGACVLVNLYPLTSTGMRPLCKMVFMGLVLFNLTAMVRYVAELAALILVQRLHVHFATSL